MKSLIKVIDWLKKIQTLISFLRLSTDIEKLNTTNKFVLSWKHFFFL